VNDTTEFRDAINQLADLAPPEQALLIHKAASAIERKLADLSLKIGELGVLLNKANNDAAVVIHQEIVALEKHLDKQFKQIEKRIAALQSEGEREEPYQDWTPQ
jgi:hypothetical protein